MKSRLVAAVLCTALAFSDRAAACAVCFGAQDDPQTKGLNMAIVTLLATTYTLFTGMIVAGFFLWRRGRILAAEAAADRPEVPRE